MDKTTKTSPKAIQRSGLKVKTFVKAAGLGANHNRTILG